MSAIAAEVARFDRLAAAWWDRHGPMRPLHVINELRLAYLVELMDQHLLRQRGRLDGLRVLDVGCGAGLLCEPLAARRANVTGIDAAAKNVVAAQAHAAIGHLSIDYRAGELTAVLQPEELFDLVLLLEIVEHVADVKAFVAAAAQHVAPGGLLVASTINRTAKSFVYAIVGAEYVFRVLPRGTHRWRRFVRPDELHRAAQAAGLAQIDLRGMRYLPVLHRASWVRDASVNYIAAYRRPVETAPAAAGAAGR